MASRENNTRRLYSTEEVLAFFQSNSNSDQTSSEDKDLATEADSNSSDDVSVEKRPKIAYDLECSGTYEGMGLENSLEDRIGEVSPSNRSKIDFEHAETGQRQIQHDNCANLSVVDSSMYLDGSEGGDGGGRESEGGDDEGSDGGDEGGEDGDGGDEGGEDSGDGDEGGENSDGGGDEGGEDSDGGGNDGGEDGVGGDKEGEDSDGGDKEGEDSDERKVELLLDSITDPAIPGGNDGAEDMHEAVVCSESDVSDDGSDTGTTEVTEESETEEDTSDSDYEELVHDRQSQRGGRGNRVSSTRGSRGGKGGNRGGGITGSSTRGGRGGGQGGQSGFMSGSTRGGRGGRGGHMRSGVTAETSSGAQDGESEDSGSEHENDLIGIPETCVSITINEDEFTPPNEFQPVRNPGPHLPDNLKEDASELDLFRLFIDDEVLERLVSATNDYAEKNKHQKANMYQRFKRHPLTNDEMMRYLGCLLLLSIDSVRNYKQAWNEKSSQYLANLHRLLTRDRFEVIASFLHVVTAEEEAQLSPNKLKKILPLHNKIKTKCLDLYQPLMQLSVDERMVKSKVRTRFRQYIRNKPTKWGYKYWVLADPTGYTIDFNIYCGSSNQEESSGKGLAYDVVAKLITPFVSQGYQLFCDNFYTSTTLFSDLLKDGIAATGTLRTNRAGVPKEVQILKEILGKKKVRRGTGYYIRPRN